MFLPTNLVHNPSPIGYSGDHLKAFKSQYAGGGWVKDVKVWHLATKDLYLIMGNVIGIIKKKYDFGGCILWLGSVVS